MLESIKYNLAHLTDFKGRDARQTFWFYVLFLVITQVGISMTISAPLAGSMIGDAFVTAQSGASADQVSTRVFERLYSMMRISIWTSVVLAFLLSLLLAASFTRRLHDSGKTGWIALATLALKIVALAMVISSIDDAVNTVFLAKTGDTLAIQAMQKKFAVQSLIGWFPTAIVVVFGVWPTTKGANRYGPEPTPA